MSIQESEESQRLKIKYQDEDDREEYKKRMKYGKTYKQFTTDDKQAYIDRMKYGKHGKPKS